MPRSPDGYRIYKNDDDKLRVYTHRIAEADSAFDRVAPWVRELFNRYAMEPRPQEHTPQGHRITTSSALSNIDAVFASLTAVEVDILVKNMGHGTRAQAELATRGIEEVWYETRANEEIEEAVQDALIGGVGWAKVGYDYAEREVEVARSDDELQAEAAAIIDAAAANREALPTPDEIAEVVPTTRMVTEVERDRIVIDYVPWDEMRVDPTAKRMKDVRWVCQVTRVPVDEVRSNPTFREYVKRRRGGLRDLERLEADTSISKQEIGNTAEPLEDEERCTIYEMWDFETGTVCTWAKRGKFLLNEQPNPLAFQDDFEDKSPFVPLITRNDKRRFHGISDLRAILPLVDEKAEYRTNVANFVARFVPKVAGPAGLLTEAGKTALKSRTYGDYVETEDGRSADEMKPLDPPALPAEAFQMEPRVEAEIRETIGVNEPMLGIFPEGRQSATEIAEVSAQSTGRHSQKRNRLERFYRDLARRVLWFMQMFYDQARVSRLVENEGDVVWEWTAEDITMEAEFRISLTPKEADTRQARRDNAIAWLNIAGAFPEVDRAALLEYVAREMGIPREDIREQLKTPEQMQEEAMGAAQQAKVQADAEAGITPSPAEVPGPETGAELSGLVNPGELPPEQAERLGAAPTVGP